MLLKRGGIWLKAMAWRAEEVPERVEALRARERRRTPERAPSAHCLDTPQPGEVGGGERCGPSRATEDARTLWIDWDSQGERYKPWRTVCQESRQLDHADLGLGGEGTALLMAKMMVGQGRDHRLWAERWLREKGIERDSRTGHELSVLTNAFYQGGVYDHLHVGGVGALKVICRRIAVLVEAHSQPSRTNWAAARFLGGAATSDEVILPGLRSYAMRRAKEEIDIQNAQQMSYTRSSGANEDDKEARDSKGARKKERRGRVLSTPDG